MTDHFALLDQPRQPLLEDEALKAKFFALSASLHPDRVAALPKAEQEQAHARYTLLNTAYNCLREPRLRLAHLIELHTGRKPAQVQQVPAELVELFFEIGQTCRAADDFLKRKLAVTSPLLLVPLFDEGQTISDRLGQLRQALSARQGQLTTELQAFNTTWQENISRLEQIQQTLSYLDRWNAQLHERIVQLAL